ncbi:MAG: CDP-glucose 4,6-dehydratase [Gammaproteobacteria bacterium]
MVAVDKDFWHGRRVLLTGHTGFKGSWLSLWLQQLGAQLVGYALPPPTIPNLFSSAHVADGMQSVIGDVRDSSQLRSAFDEHKPEIVIHMAAQSLVRRSYSEPVETYATNVMGTVNVLENCRGSDSVKVVINVTSDKCYENQGWLRGYRETDSMGGYDPYSSSKACAELVTAAYRRSFFADGNGKSIGLASARAGNVIGGGDWAEDRLIPDIIRAFLASAPVIIRNPRAVRPWQHVLEPLLGYLHLTQALWMFPPEYAEGWNFGPDESDAREVAWIVQNMVELWGGTASWRHDNSAQPYEASFLKLECTKAKTRLGWTPTLGLARALQWTVAWYAAQRDGDNMRAFSLEQIADFENLVSR